MFHLRRHTLPLLPPASQPIRILHVSDVHMLARQTRKQQWISRLAALEPDLVVTTGDNLAAPDAIEPVLAAYGRLLDRPGVFVFGSNDYYAPKFKNPLGYVNRRQAGQLAETADWLELPWRQLRRRFVDAGWLDLNQRREVLEVKGLRLAFRGTDDAHLTRDDYTLVAGPAPAGCDLSIGVTHAPYLRLVDEMLADQVDLMFAGHTHGGQVCLPGFGALVSNCDLPPSKATGLSLHGTGGHRMWLQVSAGLGSSPFAPYRFACPPEATLLTLQPTADLAQPMTTAAS